MIHSRQNYNGRVIDLLAVAALLAQAATLLEGSGLQEQGEVAAEVRKLLAPVEEQREAGVVPIPDEEPVFLLRAQDKTAATLVSQWAVWNEPEGVAPDLIQAAREHAVLMREWPKQKVAD